MFRYLVFVWNANDDSQTEAAKVLCRLADANLRDFTVSVSLNGVRAMHSDPEQGPYRAHVLPNDSGVLFGYLFSRNESPDDDMPSPTANIDSNRIQTIISSAGRSLISNYWGDYVAFLFDHKAPQTVRIIKDPTGSLPCFRTTWRGVTVVFSLLEDCLALQVMKFTVNWSYVEYRVGGGCHDSEQDSLNEVSQIHRGECLQIQPASSIRHARSHYWNPVDFSEPAARIEDPNIAAKTLRATVRSVTHTLAGLHGGILLRLSGGLDSSIVASCLKNAPTQPDITAFTSYVPGGRSDELRWARLAVQHAGVTDHIERPIEKAEIRLEGILGTRPFISPVPLLAYMESHLIDSRAAKSRGHTGIFTGDGGDSTFGSEAIGLSVDDYLTARGLRWSVVPLAAKVALCRDKLAWRILAGAMRRCLCGTRVSDFRDLLVGSATLGSKRIRDETFRTAAYPHPWFRGLNHVPWRTIFQMGALLNTPAFYDPFSDPQEAHPHRASPLYAQPLLELSLRIPLYVHFLDGHDRGLARRAFADDIPQAIRQRRWKDRSPGVFEEVAFLNREFIRDTLLSGQLIKEGLLDQAAVGAALRGTATNARFFSAELCTALDLEMWLRHFNGVQARSVAA